MLTNLKQSQIVLEIASEVQERLNDFEGGHDWWHIKRVWHNALVISKSEKNIDQFVVELAALLHDIADAKFHDGNEEIGPADCF